MSPFPCIIFSTVTCQRNFRISHSVKRHHLFIAVNLRCLISGKETFSSILSVCDLLIPDLVNFLRSLPYLMCSFSIGGNSIRETGHNLSKVEPAAHESEKSGHDKLSHKILPFSEVHAEFQ